jgi:hypothetical protein
MSCDSRTAPIPLRVHSRHSHHPAVSGSPQERTQPNLSSAILRHMKVEEIAEAVARLPPDQLARFRRWFIAFEAGRTNHAEELDSSATKLGRVAGRAFAELKRRAREP